MSLSTVPNSTSEAGPQVDVESSRAWWQQAVVYQIYPRSFADSNADGIGDLRGIVSRIDYLTKLGIDAVWLSPFYPSGWADGGYDVADYRNVDPRFGTLEDFDLLVQSLHAVGIRIMVDLVPNHSSRLHPWFVEALAAGPGSPERDRYIFRDGRGVDGSLPPNDWPSHWGPQGWTRVEDGQWYLHFFSPDQPDFNWDNAEVRQEFEHTIRFWADRGVDGFRVDVAHGLVKDMSEPYQHFTSFSPLLTPTDGSHPLFDRDDVHEIYRGWRAIFEAYDPPRMAVAEAAVPAERIPLYASSDGLNQAFNFDLLFTEWSAAEFRTAISTNLDIASSSGSPSTWVLSNHDCVRHASRYALPPGTDRNAWLLASGREPSEDRSTGQSRARAAIMLLLALPGSAYLYQGEELGLFEVANLDVATLLDPVWTRTLHTEKGRDGCRVPLPWRAATDNFGFSAGASPLHQPGWFADFAVDAQEADQSSTLALYRAAISLRKQLQGRDVLAWVDTAAEDVLHFTRPGGWQSITNFGSSPVPLPVGKVLLSSGPLLDGLLPADTTAWLTSTA